MRVGAAGLRCAREAERESTFSGKGHTHFADGNGTGRIGDRGVATRTQKKPAWLWSQLFTAQPFFWIASSFRSSQ